MDQERTELTDMQCRVKAHLGDKAGDEAACSIGLSCLQGTGPHAAVQNSSSWDWRPRTDVQCSFCSNGQRVSQQRLQVTLTVLGLKSSGTLSDVTTSASNVPRKTPQCWSELMGNCCDAQNYFCSCFVLLLLLAEKYLPILCSILIELMELN